MIQQLLRSIAFSNVPQYLTVQSLEEPKKYMVHFVSGREIHQLHSRPNIVVVHLASTHQLRKR